jgi:hypothetical protein
MQKKYKVQPGDCLSSIAAEFGFSYEILWNNQENAALKQLRKDPNILFPGDVVTIPDRENRKENCTTASSHKFRRKNIPEILHLRLLDHNGNPRSALEYTLDAEGSITNGQTDENGELQSVISTDADIALLVLRNNGQEEVYELLLGELDPADEVTGAQARLINLGFDCGVIDGMLGPITASAILEFQHQYRITESGNADEITCAKLKEIHGS